MPLLLPFLNQFLLTSHIILKKSNELNSVLFTMIAEKISSPDHYPNILLKAG